MIDKLTGGVIGLLAGLFIGILIGVFLNDSIALKAQNAAMQGAAKEIAKIEIKNTVIQQKLETQIRTEKVYQKCKHSEDAFRLIREAYGHD